MKKNMLTGDLYKTQDERIIDETWHRSSAETLINDIEAEHKGIIDWKAEAQFLAVLLFEKITECEDSREIIANSKANIDNVRDAFKRGIRKRMEQNRERIKNRRDQVDKRDFQKEITNQFDKFTTKADAIRAFQVKHQFTDYSEKTLRSWLTEDVWMKPTKPGRPKKK